MGVTSGAKRRRIEDEEDEEPLDRISRLPDGVLGDIVSFLPTKDGARTQVLSSRWRHLWRSAPLNVDVFNRSAGRLIPLGEISRVLSSHPGPGRRLSIPLDYVLGGPESCSAAMLDGWLQSSALDNLQELEFYLSFKQPPSPLPASARRFSPTLRVASFGGCSFPDGNNASALHLPVLKQLSLFDVTISERSLHSLLGRCPVLQSLFLAGITGCSRIRIMSHTIRSVAIEVQRFGREVVDLQQLIIQSAPSLERLLLSGEGRARSQIVISVIFAPKLCVLGQLPTGDWPRIEFGTTIFQGSQVANSTMAVPLSTVKILALTHINLSLDAVIDFIECFPCLENLYIKMACGRYIKYSPRTEARTTNAWRSKYQYLIGTRDIRLKKIVVTNYRGNRAHVNFAQFFVLNARLLESMVLETYVRNDHKAWIERQHTLLQITNRASSGAQFDFVPYSGLPMHREHIWSEQAHDLSTADPFVRFHSWY